VAVLTRLVAIALLLLLGLACNSSPRTIRSPSGQRVAHVTNARDAQGHKVIRVHVEPGGGGTRISLPMEWRVEHHLELVFDAEDRLWVWSSDIGTSVFVQRGAGWSSISAEERQGLQPPPAIAELTSRFKPAP